MMPTQKNMISQTTLTLSIGTMLMLAPLLSGCGQADAAELKEKVAQLEQENEELKRELDKQQGNNAITGLIKKATSGTISDTMEKYNISEERLRMLLELSARFEEFKTKINADQLQTEIVRLKDNLNILSDALNKDTSLSPVDKLKQIGAINDVLKQLDTLDESISKFNLGNLINNNKQSEANITEESTE